MRFEVPGIRRYFKDGRASLRYIWVQVLQHAHFVTRNEQQHVAGTFVCSVLIINEIEIGEVQVVIAQVFDLETNLDESSRRSLIFNQFVAALELVAQILRGCDFPSHLVKFDILPNRWQWRRNGRGLR